MAYVERWYEPMKLDHVLGDEAETIALLDEIDGGDPEGAHGMADDILLAFVPGDVREAYQRLQARCSWWATA